MRGMPTGAADLNVGLSRDSLSERIYARLRVALMTGVYESGWPSSISVV